MDFTLQKRRKGNGYNHIERSEKRGNSSLVKIHPETNQKCLFVNPVYTSHVHGMDEEESFYYC